ncbi:MAG: phosphate ABC transporter permease PstA [Magnetovibrionaceae bacterium]
MTASSNITDGSGGLRTVAATEIVRKGLKKRYAAERRFQIYGGVAVAMALAAIVILFTTIISTGLPAFTQTMIKLEVSLFPQDFFPDGVRPTDPDELQKILSGANYRTPIRQAMQDLFPEVKSRRDRRAMQDLISPGAVFILREMVMENPDLVGQRIEVKMHTSDDIDQLNKGQIDGSLPEGDRRVKDNQIEWFERLQDRGLIVTEFNTTFFTEGDSREPELAGIWSALKGSFYVMIVTLGLSFPVGVLAAVYLEEFAPKNKWTQLIEVNINNLAAVPSIVFGLLGLAMFLNFFGMPRSAPLVGGMVLALMTLPTIIIASRAALKAVPPSIREAALGLGASKMQVVFHHVLPLAMPGVLTGTIIGMAQALGETAPLLMIGMVAFIVDIPQGVTDPSTVMPVQIYLWSDSPERAFVERTSAAIMVLLGFLILMNALAVVLRKRFERKW